MPALAVETKVRDSDAAATGWTSIVWVSKRASRCGRKGVVIDGQLLRTRIVIRRQTGHPVFFSLGAKRKCLPKR